MYYFMFKASLYSLIRYNRAWKVQYSINTYLLITLYIFEKFNNQLTKHPIIFLNFLLLSELLILYNKLKPKMLSGSFLIEIFLLIYMVFFTAESARDISLSEYIKNEAQSKYYVFHTYASRQSEVKTEHFPEIQKLIYITPWNPGGYDLSIKYAHKLDYVIPCWYEIAFKKEHILIDSDGNYNQSYISAIRAKNPNIKILPRVYISGSKKSLVQAIGTVEGRFKRAVSLIATLINKQDVDGFVLQTSHNLFLRDSLFENEEDKTQNTAIKNLIVQLVNSIRINLYKRKLIFFQMPNPTKNMNEISNQRFVMLHVDGFLIQAFDSIEYDTQLKNAVMWAKLTSNIKVNAKYFIILPFFSRRQRQGIKTSQIFAALQTNGIIYQNIENSICTFIEGRSNIQSYVPCYSYFKQSFDKIKQAGFCAGFWQAGDGLQNYFLFM